MGNDYVNGFTPPTTEEIRNARPLATVLPHDALTHAMLSAAIDVPEQALEPGRRFP